MYNQDIKGRFMWDCEDTIGRGSVAYNAYKRLFELSSPLEEKSGKDLAAFDSDGFTRYETLIDEGSWRLPTMRYRACMLRYLDWCRSHTDIDVSKGTDHILDGLSEYKNSIVSGPIHLQVSLDKIFPPVDSETPDVLFRCFLWMAFAGARPKQFAGSIMVEDVDIKNRVFFYNGDTYPIYPQALEAFDRVIKANEFICDHPNYTCISKQDRVSSNKFLRGVKADADSVWLMEGVKRKTRSAHDKDPEAKRLSYRSVMHSGLFYRQYEAEAAGLDVDFAYLIKESGNYTGGRLTTRRAAINAELKDEYYVWKYLMFKDKV